LRNDTPLTHALRIGNKILQIFIPSTLSLFSSYNLQELCTRRMNEKDRKLRPHNKLKTLNFELFVMQFIALLLGLLTTHSRRTY